MDTWTARDFPSREPSSLNDAAYGNGKFVVVGSETNAAGLPVKLLLSSTNGVNWVRQDPAAQDPLLGITFANGKFLAVGGMGRILTSADGVQWQTQVVPTLNDISAVTYGGGLYLVVGQSGAMLRSADGTNWISQLLGGVELAAATYGNDRFVIAGGDSTALIMESTDAVQWRRPNFGNTFQEMRGVAYGNGLFVAVGDRETILTSTDTVAWQPRRSGTETLRWVTFAEGRFVAVGGRNSLPGLVLSSTNGVDWVKHDLSNATGVTLLRGVTFGQGTFLVVGDHGIAQSGIVSSALRLGLNYESSAALEIFGTPGQRLDIESSSDLTGATLWRVRTNLTLFNSPQSWLDSNASQYSRQFYRVRTVP